MKIIYESYDEVHFVSKEECLKHEQIRELNKQYDNLKNAESSSLQVNGHEIQFNDLCDWLIANEKFVQEILDKLKPKDNNCVGWINLYKNSGEIFPIPVSDQRSSTTISGSIIYETKKDAENNSMRDYIGTARFEWKSE